MRQAGKPNLVPRNLGNPATHFCAILPVYCRKSLAAAHEEHCKSRRPKSMRNTRSFLVYLGLIACLAGVKLAIDCLPRATFASPSQAAIFAWPSLAIIGTLGLIGVWLSLRTGFPGMWDPGTNMQAWLWRSAWLGIALALVEVGWDYTTKASHIMAERMGFPTFHIAFPASALIYPGGAIIVEIVYRLLPLPLVVFLISNLALRGKCQNQVFWTAAVVLSAFEPVSQSGLLSLAFGHEFKMRGHEWLVAGEMIQGYAMNLAQAYLFRKAGFLCPVVFRICYYILWHVVWGSLMGM
jgi:hypothetical protein